MLFLYAIVACTSGPTGEAGTAAIVAPVLTHEADPALTVRAYETAPPVACPEDIDVAQAGYTTTDPVLADAHALTYGAAPSPSQVHVGWTGDPSTSIAMVWRTDADTLLTQVQIGLDDSYGTTLDGRSFLLGFDTADGRVHELHVCGLSPDTSWHYRVGGEGAWSDDHTFTTAPVPGSTDPIVLGVAGDSRGSPTTWGEVVAAQATHGVDFRLFTGDAVTNGGTISYWDDWYDAAKGYIESTVLMSAHGNHEGLSEAYFALAALPGNEQWYSFDYANVHFVALNDSLATSADWAIESDWLAADLAATTQPWKIVFHHKAAYTNCIPDGEDANVKTWFVPVEEAGGVQLDLAGHDHNYERTVPMAGGAAAVDVPGTTYVVTAGAGAPLYTENQAHTYMAVGVQTQHYVILSVDGPTLTATAYDLGGNVIDTFTLTQQ